MSAIPVRQEYHRCASQDGKALKLSEAFIIRGERQEETAATGTFLLTVKLKENKSGAPLKR